MDELMHLLARYQEILEGLNHCLVPGLVNLRLPLQVDAVQQLVVAEGQHTASSDVYCT